MRFLALVLALGACSNPDEVLPMHGRVISNDAVEGQVVRVIRQSQAVSPQYYGECKPESGQQFKETLADAEGQYRFALLRGETTSFTNFLVFCFRVETTFPSGSISWTDPASVVTELPLAPLRDWRPSLSIDAGVLHFEPIIPWPVEMPPLFNGETWEISVALSHSARVTTPDGAIIWKTTDRFDVFDGGASYRRPMVLDEVRLEDFAGVLVLDAQLDEHVAIPLGISSFPVPPVWMRGPSMTVAGSTPAVSRGLPCPEFASPCPFTDGLLIAVDAGFREEVSLVLERPTMLETIVLREATVAPPYRSWPHVDALITLEDGGTLLIVQELVSSLNSFTYEPPVMTPDGGYARTQTVFLSIPVDAGAPAVSVKLLFPGGLVSASEISLFE